MKGSLTLRKSEQAAFTGDGRVPSGGLRESILHLGRQCYITGDMRRQEALREKAGDAGKN